MRECVSGYVYGHAPILYVCMCRWLRMWMGTRICVRMLMCILMSRVRCAHTVMVMCMCMRMRMRM